jgi:flagellar motor switch protein FliN/FliY
VTELRDDDRAAIEELSRQVAGHVSTAAKPTWQELPFNLALAQAPTWPAAASGWIRSGAGAPAEVVLAWQMSAALNASLTTAEQQKAAANTPETPAATSDPDRLGFFMDLELDVTLRFGGRNILLKDILQLGPGSVLELDREIQDPADLLLDGKLIARGEVLMVDGNYGLRVKEVFTGPQLPM